MSSLLCYQFWPIHQCRCEEIATDRASLQEILTNGSWKTRSAVTCKPKSLSPFEAQSKSLSPVEAKRASKYPTDHLKSLSLFEQKLEAQYSTVQSHRAPPVEAKYSFNESKFSFSASENCFSSELKFTSNEQAKLSTVVSKFSSTLIESYHKLFALENAVRDQEM